MRERIQRGLARRRQIRRQRVCWGDDRELGEDVLYDEMVGPVAQVADIQRVVLAKRVLDAQVPLHRVRHLLLRRNPRGGVVDGVVQIENSDAASATWKGAVGKEIRCQIDKTRALLCRYDATVERASDLGRY